MNGVSGSYGITKSLNISKTEGSEMRNEINPNSDSHMSKYRWGKVGA